MKVYTVTLIDGNSVDVEARDEHDAVLEAGVKFGQDVAHLVDDVEELVAVTTPRQSGSGWADQLAAAMAAVRDVHERVACPLCGARQGEPCTHVGRRHGTPLKHAHAERLHVAGVYLR